MTAHDHTERQSRCPRCGLSADEVGHSGTCDCCGDPWCGECNDATG